MIVQMKKAAIIVRQEDVFEAISQVRSLGVLHVENQEAPKGKDVSCLQENLALLNSCLDVFGRAGALSENSKPEMPALNDWRLTAKHVTSLWKRYDQLESFLHSIKNTINEWERWGDFNPQEIRSLSEKGIFVRLYQIPIGQLKQLPAEAAVKIIFSSGGVVGCAVVSNKKIDIPFKEMALPKHSLLTMRERLAEDKKAMEGIRNEINKIASYYSQFLDIKRNLEKEIEFQQALCGMGKEGALSYITGYLPFDKVEELKKRSHQQRWGILIIDPSQEDNVPVLIRNPRWISIVSPIFKFLDIFPGYREWDISPVFIVFFSLFFGMLIGDAGYGLIYIILTFLVQKKTGAKTKDKSVFTLFYLLSSCAIIWGLLTGTFFGQEWFLKAGYKPLVPALNNPNQIQTFCFFVGALHLTIAHIWRAVIKLPSCASLADVGWICVVWSVFLLARMLILGEVFPYFGAWLISVGIGLVVLFNNPQKNVLKILNTDLITLALGLISSFGEVVSYIRLFAVGMAGVAIADGFNAMAARIGTGSVVALIASVFVAMLGHLLCLVLGPLSVLVHGIRLNLLEFSGHANISWSGLAYRPLKE